MKLLSLIIAVLTFFFVACEDTKKTTLEKTNSATVTTKTNDTITSISEKNNVKSDTVPSEMTYPKLTNKNVVQFLTQYGKDNPETHVRIITQFGDIEIELSEDTPLHRANFIYLVKQDYFYGTFFHRVVPNFIIQGGSSDNVKTSRKRTKIGKDYLLPAEIIPGRIHKYGTISGAKEYRKNPDKQTAPFEFFIFLGPKSSTSHLNGNYTVFGWVTKGMELVEKIANLPSDEGDWPLQNVYIETELLK